MKCGWMAVIDPEIEAVGSEWGDEGLNRMPTYQIEVTEGPDGAIEVACDEHHESEVFHRAYRKVSFFCSGCGREVVVRLENDRDWWAWGERC